MRDKSIISAEEWLQLQKKNDLPKKKVKQNKFGACLVDTADGKFHSIAEHSRYRYLTMLQAAHEIGNLRRQVKYPLIVNDMRVTAYVADFVYVLADGQEIVEDVKGCKAGMAYDNFCLKKKLMKACLGIDVVEVTKYKTIPGQSS